MEVREQKQELLSKLYALEKEHPTTKIRTPDEVLPLLHKYRNRKQECFFAVLLDGAHQVIKVLEISRGLVNRTIVHPREVFRPAVVHCTTAIIVVHNHPSGETEPSMEDRSVTARLVKAGEELGIRVLDHVVFSNKGYHSFMENDEI